MRWADSLGGSPSHTLKLHLGESISDSVTHFFDFKNGV
jgi:hypothetical protein